MDTRTSRAAERSPRSGFTLLEVLAALAVLSTALVALLGLHARNLRIVAHDVNLSRATLLAEQVMTRTLATEPFPEPSDTSGRFETDPEYRWQVVVLASENRDLEERVREIRVRVAWDADHVDLVTMVRRPDA